MYLFEAALEDSTGATKELLVVFSGQMEPSERDYASIFEREFQKFLKPDGLLFICPGYAEDNIRAFLDDQGPFCQNITRFGNNVPVQLFSFDEYGALRPLGHIFGEIRFRDVDNTVKDIVAQGLLYLSREHIDEVLVESPPGTIFSKPSGQSSQEFIKASGLARSYSQQQFVGFGLLAYRPRNIQVKDIYIDTASIANFAEIVSFYLYRLSGSPCKTTRYCSYSSYGGMEKCKPDDPDSVWVIISASFNNSMYKEIVSTWSLSSDQVVTILAFTDDGRRLVNIKPLSRHLHAKEKSDSAVKVQVVGENFTAEISAPHRVLIKNSHKPKNLDRVIRPFFKNNVFQCNRTVGSSDLKTIYVDFNSYVASHQLFDEWLEKVIKWYLPTNLGWVIADTTHEGRMLYEAFDKKLKAVGIDNSFSVIGIKDAGREVVGDKAVVVLVPAISSGRTLLNLNRELRLSNHAGNRIFICPFALSSSEEELKKLKNSLLQGLGGLKYLFLSCFDLYVGRQENSWELEKKVVAALSSDNEFWQSRLGVLEMQGDGLKGEVACPPIKSGDKRSFSPGFVFWRDWNADSDEANHEAIYVTVASVLQSLRERHSIDGSNNDSLKSNVYQHAVIDPDNFTRFNDAILQSCIWRAAYSTELDYRRSDELSDAIVTIILRLIHDFTSNKSDAALDMLMGIATKKIAISKKCLTELVSRAMPLLACKEEANLLLQYIKTNLM